MRLSGKSFYLLALVAVIIIIIGLNNLRESKFGREISAVRDHPNAAAAAGINPAATRLVVLVIAASLAAVAGWLHTFYYLNLNPVVVSPELTFIWFFMVLVGSLGSMTGVVLRYCAAFSRSALSFLGLPPGELSGDRRPSGRGHAVRAARHCRSDRRSAAQGFRRGCGMRAAVSEPILALRNVAKSYGGMSPFGTFHSRSRQAKSAASSARMERGNLRCSI